MTSESLNSSSIDNINSPDIEQISVPDNIVDDNSELIDEPTKKREMILNMKAIGNYNDIKYKRMPAKRIRIFS
jgi:hypothetical protein